MICFWGGVCYNEVIYLCAECSEEEFAVPVPTIFFRKKIIL